MVQRARCRWYTDQGEPGPSGPCRNISACTFVHPSDPGWDSARPSYCMPPRRDSGWAGRGGSAPGSYSNSTRSASGFGQSRGTARRSPPPGPSHSSARPNQDASSSENWTWSEPLATDNSSAAGYARPSWGDSPAWNANPVPDSTVAKNPGHKSPVSFKQDSTWGFGDRTGWNTADHAWAISDATSTNNTKSPEIAQGWGNTSSSGWGTSSRQEPTAYQPPFSPKNERRPSATSPVLEQPQTQDWGTSSRWELQSSAPVSKPVPSASGSRDLSIASNPSSGWGHSSVGVPGPPTPQQEPVVHSNLSSTLNSGMDIDSRDKKSLNIVIPARGESQDFKGKGKAVDTPWVSSTDGPSTETMNDSPHPLNRDLPPISNTPTNATSPAQPSRKAQSPNSASNQGSTKRTILPVRNSDDQRNSMKKFLRYLVTAIFEHAEVLKLEQEYKQYKAMQLSPTYERCGPKAQELLNSGRSELMNKLKLHRDKLDQTMEYLVSRAAFFHPVSNLVQPQPVKQMQSILQYLGQLDSTIRSWERFVEHLRALAAAPPEQDSNERLLSPMSDVELTNEPPPQRAPTPSTQRETTESRLADIDSHLDELEIKFDTLDLPAAINTFKERLEDTVQWYNERHFNSSQDHLPGSTLNMDDVKKSLSHSADHATALREYLVLTKKDVSALEQGYNIEKEDISKFTQDKEAISTIIRQIEQQHSSGFSELRLDQDRVNQDIDGIRERLKALPQPAPTPPLTKAHNPYILGQSIREEIKEEVTQLLNSMRISLQQTMEQHDRRLLEKVSRLARHHPGAS